MSQQQTFGCCWKRNPTFILFHVLIRVEAGEKTRLMDSKGTQMCFPFGECSHTQRLVHQCVVQCESYRFLLLRLRRGERYGLWDQYHFHRRCPNINLSLPLSISKHSYCSRVVTKLTRPQLLSERLALFSLQTDFDRSPQIYFH